VSRIETFPEGNFLEFTRANEWGCDIFANETLANGTRAEVWDSGVIAFFPPASVEPGNRDLVLSCAVHGDETAPIEICDELIEKLRSGELVPANRVLFLIANPAAINIGERFVEENMNRLFSGAHSQEEGLINKERKRAKAIEGYVKRFFDSAPDGARERLHYDMHTAIRDSRHEKFAVYPHQNGRPYKKRQLQLLQAMGVSTVLLHEGPTTTFSYFSVNEFEADAFTVELGKVRPFGQNDMTRFEAAKQTLIQLIVQHEPDLPEFSPEQHQIYRVLRSINRNHNDFRLNFPDDVANFTSFPKGYELAYDGGTPVVVEQEGESVIFPNANVALGQRALLTVVQIPTTAIDLV